MTKETRSLVIHLGLNPSEPMLDWDREKAAVVDATTGRRVGFVDENDGIRVTVILNEVLRDDLREALEQADVHLGRMASSEPLSAQEYRQLGMEARRIVRAALAGTGEAA